MVTVPPSPRRQFVSDGVSAAQPGLAKPRAKPLAQPERALLHHAGRGRHPAAEEPRPGAEAGQGHVITWGHSCSRGLLMARVPEVGCSAHGPTQH